MLVLTRKLGEEIIIGGEIVVTVVDVANGRVKLGIQAPKSVRVDRSEVRDQREKADAPMDPVVIQNRLTTAQRPGTPTDPAVVAPAARPPFKRKSR